MATPLNPIFHDEEKARQHLEALRWPKYRVCPHCGETERTSPTESKNHKPGLYICLSCKLTFTVTVGTLFERSHIPLFKWLHAFHLMAASKKGISSLQLQRQLELGSYKTAWFMSHRIREAMKPEAGGMLGGGGKVVEADETYIGRKPGRKLVRAPAHKNAVFSLVERGGKVRSRHIPDVSGKTLRKTIVTQVDRASYIMTDEAPQYKSIGREFSGHGSVNHSAEEYVRAYFYHTNTVEGYFSILKRGIVGVYHHTSKEHLHRYLAEFDYRYNNREANGVNDAERMRQSVQGIVGRRLTYRRIGSGPNL
jgi:transposase-like protein